MSGQNLMEIEIDVESVIPFVGGILGLPDVRGIFGTLEKSLYHAPRVFLCFVVPVLHAVLASVNCFEVELVEWFHNATQGAVVMVATINNNALLLVVLLLLCLNDIEAHRVFLDTHVKNAQHVDYLFLAPACNRVNLDRHKPYVLFDITKIVVDSVYR